ncbi:MAG: DUF3365 domain-containing protein [Pseudomonadales bacterium]|nr:DUF3365 domain-containing protein [Pseudomonadales bacterium]
MNPIINCLKNALPISSVTIASAIAAQTTQTNSNLASPVNVDEQALVEQARGITQQYGGALKKTLKATIMTSGPAAAIRTCSVHAPGISEQTAQLTGWQIHRTSNKIRNPNNKPNIWETQVLQQFADKAERGAPIENLEHHQVIMENGKPVFRYMKAIKVQNLCLNCHGTHVSGPVKSAIKNLFPLDNATGYREGDLRGAFTLKLPLK